jgi:hypothetical protein
MFSAATLANGAFRVVNSAMRGRAWRWPLALDLVHVAVAVAATAYAWVSLTRTAGPDGFQAPAVAWASACGRSGKVTDGRRAFPAASP